MILISELCFLYKKFISSSTASICMEKTDRNSVFVYMSRELNVYIYFPAWSL